MLSIIFSVIKIMDNVAKSKGTEKLHVICLLLVLVSKSFQQNMHINIILKLLSTITISLIPC